MSMEEAMKEMKKNGKCDHKPKPFTPIKNSNPPYGINGNINLGAIIC